MELENMVTGNRKMFKTFVKANIMGKIGSNTEKLASLKATVVN
jgi:hypothetical protein